MDYKCSLLWQLALAGRDILLDSLKLGSSCILVVTEFRFNWLCRALWTYSGGPEEVSYALYLGEANSTVLD